MFKVPTYLLLNIFSLQLKSVVLAGAIKQLCCCDGEYKEDISVWLVLQTFKALMLTQPDLSQACTPGFYNNIFRQNMPCFTYFLPRTSLVCISTKGNSNKLKMAHSRDAFTLVKILIHFKNFPFFFF